MRGLIFTAIILVAVIILVVYLNKKNGNPLANIAFSVPEASASGSPAVKGTKTLKDVEFISQTKSKHFKSSDPAHGVTLNQMPETISIQFDSPLTSNSRINIINAGRVYGLDETLINGLSMTRKIDPNAPDEVYTVTYDACWVDRSCHSGNFQFAVDREDR